MKRLQTRKALICGGSRGIGYEIAAAFIEHGAEVVTLSRGSCKVLNDNHRHIIVDLAATELLVKVLVTELGETPSFDILVNNSGGPSPGLLIEASTEQLLEGFRQHLLAAHILTKLIVPKMKAARFGRIINIISTSVREPIDGLGVSNTIRGAMAAWSKTLARELGPFGIIVNSILPGATNTERLNTLIEGKAKKLGCERIEVEEEMLDEIPLRRFANPQEIANLAIFLASEEASYISGTCIPVDGARMRSI